MDIEGIREALRREPFESFVLRLADGRAMEVRHREFAAIAPSGRRMIVIDPDDRSHFIEPLLIVSIEYPIQSAGAVGGSPTTR